MMGVVPELDRRVNVYEVGMVKLCEVFCKSFRNKQQFRKSRRPQNGMIYQKFLKELPSMFSEIR